MSLDDDAFSELGCLVHWSGKDGIVIDDTGLVSARYEIAVLHEASGYSGMSQVNELTYGIWEHATATGGSAEFPFIYFCNKADNIFLSK